MKDKHKQYNYRGKDFSKRKEYVKAIEDFTNNQVQAVRKETFTDSRDGNKYKIVKIGEQIWMAENLNYAATAGCMCNDEYGRLYSWAAAKEACPPGWHLPSDAEWDVLVKYVDPDWTSNDEKGNVSGFHLKAKDSWSENGNGGQDTFGFSALPGGGGYSNRNLRAVGIFGIWWSATEIDASNTWVRFMFYNREDVGRNYSGKSDNLFSVRCLKDTPPIA